MKKWKFIIDYIYFINKKSIWKQKYHILSCIIIFIILKIPAALVKRADQGVPKCPSVFMEPQRHYLSLHTEAAWDLKVWILPQVERAAAINILGDAEIEFTEEASVKKYPEKLRMTRIHDSEQNRDFAFLPNDLSLPVLKVENLYRNRWQVELFFKWLK